MRKKIEVEIELPDCISPDFIEIISRADHEEQAIIKSFILGVLYKCGKVTDQELFTQMKKD